MIDQHLSWMTFTLRQVCFHESVLNSQDIHSRQRKMIKTIWRCSFLGCYTFMEGSPALLFFLPGRSNVPTRKIYPNKMYSSDSKWDATYLIELLIDVVLHNTWSPSHYSNEGRGCQHVTGSERKSEEWMAKTTLGAALPLHCLTKV